ncbi:hypothetical protein [Streptomyces sp. BPTC-684]|uniref:hypothetical protein n=1 Tax=Streptomyces sp. BPTC-684 TaxID=3043734 RepID=UPI0024B1B63C|nr:hypothetical protein [Streptomyces sp. BPTC-684]WHM41251.1 hypothetical protein QIY60_08580 [Streptomyces sp. BPTC-684]
MEGEGLYDGLDAVEMDVGLWSPGVDYLAGWREARVAADRLNRALLAAGFELSELRASATTTGDGRGVVRLAGWPGVVDRLARCLERAADDDGDAAP